MTHTLTLTGTTEQARPELVDGRWSVDTCATFHNEFGGWRMAFRRDLTFPIVLTLEGVAAHLAASHRPVLLPHEESVSMHLVSRDPSGAVRTAVLWVVR
jgi:hypothetical protein